LFTILKSHIKTAPDGSIFVLDEKQFLKFDKKGKFIKNLFKKGQGPGEFLFAPATSCEN
jgi:hypothetical protein